MEHSALHAIQLIGLVMAVGGVFLVVGLLWPALRIDSGAEPLASALQASVERWIFRGALLAALATFLDLFVQVAEVQGKTIFGGVNLSLWGRFVSETIVGRLALARIAALLLTAAAVQLSGKFKWPLIGGTALAAVILTSLVSHSAAQPINPWRDVAIQVTHITAAAVWMGILCQLLGARRWLEGEPGRQGIGLIAELIRRFSPVALTVTALLALSGLFMFVRLAGGGLLTSAYGLTLIVKMVLLVPALVAGFVNFRVIRPQLIACAAAEGEPDAPAPRRRAASRVAQIGNLLNRRMALGKTLQFYRSVNFFHAGGLAIGETAGWHPGLPAEEYRPAVPAPAQGGVLRRFGRMLELEVTAGVLVIMAAGILASISPPGESGWYRLTPEQTHALLQPRIPAATVINPDTFYGAAERTLADLKYSEFTHHWSGVMVCLLGLAWLVQGLGGRPGKWAERGWPWLLVPFMVFVAVAADPEVWLLRRVSIRQALGDPQLLEHQLGAGSILVLAWFGWRDRGRPAAQRPLGYALPAIFILGGSLLLGHAHSTLNVNEQVTNLINVQHAIFGAFIIFAGTVRWLSLRGLFSPRWANVIWPMLIGGLGVFMAFFYRETI